MTQEYSEYNSANEGGQLGHAGRHARRVSYRGSDDYVVSEVGSPETVAFSHEADLSGFDKLAIEHAPDAYTVETVGTADPFKAADAANLTRPFTSAYPQSEPLPHGYSEFGAIADGEPYTYREPAGAGRTAVQRPLAVTEVGGQPQGGAAEESWYSEGPAEWDMSGRGGENGKKGRKQKKGAGAPAKPHRKLKRVLIVIAIIVAAAIASFFVFTRLLDAQLDESERTKATESLTATTYDKPFYALILGCDMSPREEVGEDGFTGQRSDVMMLARIDPTQHQVTLVSIPRDTRYEWPDGSVSKINDCYFWGGAEAAVRAVSELTGVEISHYAALSFDDLDEIVDALGGVTIDLNAPIDQKMEGRRVVLEPGVQEVNGLEALAFARSRHNYEDGDTSRQSNVRQLASAIMDKVMDKSIYEMPATVLELAKYVSTDMRSGDIISLALAMSGGSGDMTVYDATGPSEGDIFDDGYWYCYPNPEGWARLMEIVDAGGDPSDIEY